MWKLFVSLIWEIPIKQKQDMDIILLLLAGWWLSGVLGFRPVMWSFQQTQAASHLKKHQNFKGQIRFMQTVPTVMAGAVYSTE